MLARRFVYGRVIALAGTLAIVGGVRATAAAPRPRIEFLAPAADTMVLGPTTIRLAVQPPSLPIDRIDIYADGALIGAARPPDLTLEWLAPTDRSPGQLRAVAYNGANLVAEARIRLAAHELGAHVDVVAVQLFPVVQHGSRYVGDLTADDFTVLEDGHPVAIESFSRQAAELNVALVIDKSASMEPKLAFVQQAAVRFIASLRPSDLVSVHAADHALATLAGPSTDHAAARRATLDMVSGGGSAIHDAVLLVLTQMRQSAGRKVLVLFSDGLDSHSIATPTRVAARARESEVILYAIGSRSPRARREDLEIMTRDSGGQLQLVDDPTELVAVFTAILSEIQAQYALAFTPRPGPPGVRRIEVRTSNPAHRVRCRRSYTYGNAP